MESSKEELFKEDQEFNILQQESFKVLDQESVDHMLHQELEDMSHIQEIKVDMSLTEEIKEDILQLQLNMLLKEETDMSLDTKEEAQDMSQEMQEPLLMVQLDIQQLNKLEDMEHQVDMDNNM